MKGIQIRSYVTSLDELNVSSSLASPQPQASEYLISVRACAANFFDILQVRGQYQHQPPFPWVSGCEFAGVVIGVPRDGNDKRFQVGDRVFGAAQGAFAEVVACHGNSLLPVPKGWGFVEAAGLYITAPTAHAALITRARLARGEWVLVHAAAGGVSLAAIQIAKAAGATVIATASSQAKLDIARSFGADHLVNYSTTTTATAASNNTPDPTTFRWVAQVSEILRAHKRTGVDVIFDPVGLINPSLKLASWNARILVVGFTGGEIEKVAANRILLKNVALLGIHWGMYARFQPSVVDHTWKALYTLIERGEFRPTVYRDREFVGLHSVREALKALGARKTWGKVVIKIPPEDEEAVADRKSVV